MSRNERGISTSIIILIVSAVLAVVAAILVLLQHRAATHPAAVVAARPPMTDAQKAYLPSLAFSDLRVSAAVNFLGDTVTYLDGTVTNKGDKVVSKVEVQLTFFDTIGQLALRETHDPLAGHAKALGPGESSPFRITFEHMPAEWNQAPPRAKAVYVEF